MSQVTRVCSHPPVFDEPTTHLRLVDAARRVDEFDAPAPQCASGGPTDGDERSLRFTAALLRETKWFVARAIEIDVVSQGSSIEEALANLREALELYFEVEAAPPTVEAPIIASIDVTVRS